MHRIGTVRSSRLLLIAAFALLSVTSACDDPTDDGGDAGPVGDAGDVDGGGPIVFTADEKIVSTEPFVRTPVDVETPIDVAEPTPLRNVRIDPATVTWTSSDPQVVTVVRDTHGSTFVRGHVAGQATLLAACATGSTIVSVVITDATATSVDVVIESGLPKSLPRRVRTIATFDDGSQHDVTSLAPPTTTTEGATVELADVGGEPTATLTADEAGSVDVGATLAGLPSGSTSIRITEDSLNVISIDARSNVVPQGMPTKIRAEGGLADGRWVDLSDFVVWSVVPADAARFDPDEPGTLIPTGTGDFEVQATFGAQVGTTTFTIGTEAPTELAIEKSFPFIGGDAGGFPAGYSRAYDAMSYFADGTNSAVTNAVVWSTSDPAIATVSNRRSDAGVVHAHAAGTFTLRARLGDRTAELEIEVNDAQLVSLGTLDGGATEFSMLLRQFRRLEVFGTFDDGTKILLREPIEFTTSRPCVRSVDGFVEPLDTGRCDLVATIDGVSMTRQILVRRLESLTVMPGSVPYGAPVELSVFEVFGASTLGDELTDGATFSLVSGTSTLTRDAGEAPILTALDRGSVVVHVTYDDPTTTGASDDGLFESDFWLTVDETSPTGITIGGDDPRTVFVGETPDLGIVVAHYGALGALDVSSYFDGVATWTSSDPSVLEVVPPANPANGQRVGFAAVGVGTVTLSVHLYGRDASITVHVAPFGSLEITGASSLTVPETAPLEGSGVDVHGVSTVITEELTWTSDDPAIATVSNDPGTRGVVTAIAPGTTTIRATLGGATSTTYPSSPALEATWEITVGP